MYINVYMYTCVCMCVCIYIHTHTHTHTYISTSTNWGDLGPGTSVQVRAGLSAGSSLTGQRRYHRQLWYPRGRKQAQALLGGYLCPPIPHRVAHTAPAQLCPLTWLVQRSMYQWRRMASRHPHDRVANAHSFSLVTLLHVFFFLTAPCSLWDPSSLTRD